MGYFYNRISEDITLQTIDSTAFISNSFSLPIRQCSTSSRWYLRSICSTRFHNRKSAASMSDDLRSSRSLRAMFTSNACSRQNIKLSVTYFYGAQTGNSAS